MYKKDLVFNYAILFSIYSLTDISISNSTFESVVLDYYSWNCMGPLNLEFISYEYGSTPWHILVPTIEF
jgi:hypothetical protein